MKKYATTAFIAIALMMVIGFAGSAFSEDATLNRRNPTDTAITPGQTTTTATASCAATCPKFIDANKDGICDSMAVHHADGKCANMAQCMKDGKCPGTCKNHAEAMKTTTPASGCDPTKCLTSPNGCPMKAKAGCKSGK